MSTVKTGDMFVVKLVGTQISMLLDVLARRRPSITKRLTIGTDVNSLSGRRKVNDKRQRFTGRIPIRL